MTGRLVRVVYLSCLLAVAFSFEPARSAENPSGGLDGLWTAERMFAGVSGTLIVVKRGNGYTADIDGFSVPVQQSGATLSFRLPNGRGAFEGRLAQDGRIAGHWISASPAGGFPSQTPVHLRPSEKHQWVGQVNPPAATFTLHLLLKSEGSGTYAAVLQNPERDFGTFLGVQSLIFNGGSVRLMGQRPGAEQREVAAGTFDAERQVITLAFPDFGGSYDLARDPGERGFYPREPHEHYAYVQPVQRPDGWPVASPQEVGISQSGIERFVQKLIDTPMDAQDAPQVHALLIARHGKLVAEEYFHGFDRDTPHDTRSAGKSLTAVLVGAAMHSGARLSLFDHVYAALDDHPVDADPRRQALTLRNLLTMSSGFDCDEANPDSAGFEDKMYEQSAEPNWVRYALRFPMAFDPGQKAVYCSSDPNLALAMVGRAAARNPVDLFDDLVATPLRFGNYAWPLDGAGNPFGGGGVKILPRDFLKLAQLLMSGGIWQGRRIVDARFSSDATSPQYHLRNIAYGYLWWGIDYPYKGRTVHAFFAAGAGGQAIMAIPALDTVIAIFNGNYSSKTQKDVQQNYVPRYILPAILEPGDDSSQSVTWREDYSTPYGKSDNSAPISPP